MDEMYDGILESWYAICGQVSGQIYYDSKERFADGTHIRTSTIIAPDGELKSGDVICTKNSTYVLGMPYEDVEIEDCRGEENDEV